MRRSIWDSPLGVVMLALLMVLVVAVVLLVLG